MSEPDEQARYEQRRLRRRYRRNMRFKVYCASALLLAGAFLGYFLIDLAVRGYPAFKQAQIQATFRYTEISAEAPPAAVGDEKQPFVSRGAMRTITMRMTEAPRAEVHVGVDRQGGEPAKPMQAVRPIEQAKELTAAQLRELISPDAAKEIRAERSGDHELVIDKDNLTPGKRWVWASKTVDDYLARFQAVTKVEDVSGFYMTPSLSGDVTWTFQSALTPKAKLQVRLLELTGNDDGPSVLAAQTFDQPVPKKPADAADDWKPPTGASYELDYKLEMIELGRTYLVEARATVDGRLVQRASERVLNGGKTDNIQLELAPVAPDEGGIDYEPTSPASSGFSLKQQQRLRRLYLDNVIRRRFNDMIGTKETKWVAAVSDVDQYMQLPADIRNTLGEVTRDLAAIQKQLADLPDEANNPQAKQRRQALEKRADKLRNTQQRLSRETRLTAEQVVQVQQLREAGEIAFGFNSNFFLNGDSQLPEQAGIFSATVGTILVLLLVLLFSFPIGVLTAVYLEEFAPDNRFTQLIEVNINNLAAVPSILFGLLGLAVFINVTRRMFGVDIASTALVAGLTLSLMTLPIIIISTRAALRAVPASIRLGAMAMGATRWQTVCHHVLPQSISGILTGAIIGVAQAIGETAPLIIIGLVAFIPGTADGVFDPTTVLPAQIYKWSTQSLSGFRELTAAGILVLLAVLMTMNATAVLLRARFEKRW